VLIDDLTQLPKVFKTGFRGIILLYRTKDGAEGNPHRTCIKRISANEEEFDLHVKNLNEMRLERYPEHRIYASVNARDIQKAIREFKRRQLDVDYDQHEINNRFYIDIENRFFSCFMNPSCKSESNFLFDCDTMQEYIDCSFALKNNNIEYFDYSTKNGWHIITKAFNYNKFQLPVEPKKDDLIAIAA
jgi:hypothetical protein